MHKRRRSGCESVVGALANRDGMKAGGNDPTYPRFLERTLCALRGFGCFDIAWGIGSYGENFTELARRIGADNTEELRLHRIKCKITNRFANGFSMPKMGSVELGYVDGETSFWWGGALRSCPNEDLEEHFITYISDGRKPDQPKTADVFRRCVENQPNMRCLFFGEQYRAERETCLRNLIELREDTP